MDIKEKLDILSSSAKFDVDTEPSIIDTVTNLENDNMPGSIYYSKTSNGECMPLLKVLFLIHVSMIVPIVLTDEVTISLGQHLKWMN